MQDVAEIRSSAPVFRTPSKPATLRDQPAINGQIQMAASGHNPMIADIRAVAVGGRLPGVAGVPYLTMSLRTCVRVVGVGLVLCVSQP